VTDFASAGGSMFSAKNESMPSMRCSNTGNAAMTVSAIVISGTSASSDV